MKYILFILVSFQCFGAGLLSMPGTLENITPSPIRGLVAYWIGNDTLSNDVAYSSFTTLTAGSGTNHLTKVNNAGPGTNLLAGGSFGFTNRVANYWRIPSASSQRLMQVSSNYVSAMCWVYPYSNNFSQYFWGNTGNTSTSTNDSHGVGIQSPTIYPLRWGSNYVIAPQLNRTPVNPTTNSWQQFFYEIDVVNNINKLWVNLNYAQNTAPNISSIQGSTKNFGLGTFGDGTSTIALGGDMAHCAIWSGSRGGLSPTLTSNEVRFLWNEGRGRKFPFNSGSGP